MDTRNNILGSTYFGLPAEFGEANIPLERASCADTKSVRSVRHLAADSKVRRVPTLAQLGQFNETVKGAINGSDC